MAQNLPEIRRLPNLGVRMDKNVWKNREPSSELEGLASQKELCLSFLKVKTLSAMRFFFFFFF